MKGIIGFIFITLAGFSNVCFAEITQAKNISIIENILKSANRDTLVIFDVDDVLLRPNDQILQAQNRKYLESLNSKLEKSVGQENAKIFYSIIFEQRQNSLVDVKMKDIISHLQSKGIKVLALTNCFTGAFGNIKSMQNWRYHELSKNGYHFEQSWKKLKDKTFEGLEKTGNSLSAKNHSVPVFMKGIVFTSAVSKGKTLEAFLKYARVNPKKIIFIDDKKKHLESVQDMTSADNIPFIGIEYTAASDLKKDPLNRKRADFQYEILEKHKRWVSDSKANSMLVTH